MPEQCQARGREPVIRDQGAAQPRLTGQVGTGMPADSRAQPSAGPLRAGELLDEALITVLGPVDDLTGDAIAGICNDALHAVLGPAITRALLADRRLLPLAAPWVRDLARGPQYQCRHDGPETAPNRAPSACWPVSAGRA